MPATITGTIASTQGSGSWVLTFCPQETPQGLSGVGVVVGQDVKCVTDSSGALPASFTLQEGRYVVEVNNGEQFEIDVPSGSDSYNILDLIVSEEDTAADLSGEGSPEGVQTAEPGTTYWDTVAKELWVKDTGSGNTGWRRHG